jgi:hypothetical protein
VISNNARVARALYLLKLDLDNFVAREFSNYHQDQTLAVLNQILGQSRDSQNPFRKMKTQDLLAVVQASWWNVFDRAMGGIEPGLIRELALTHESWAGRNNFSAESAYQALNSVQRLLAAMSSPSTLELDMLKRECLESEIAAAEPEEEEAPVSPDRPAETEVVSPSVPSAETDSIAADRLAAADAVVEDVVEATEEETVASDEEPYAADLLRALRETGALREEDYLARAAREGIQARYADDSLVQELNASFAPAWDEQGMRRILDCQGEALSHILAGSNLVLEAGWGADETGTLALVLAESLLQNPGSRGLVLCREEESVGALAERLSAMLAVDGVPVTTGTKELPEPQPDSGEPLPPSVLVASVDSLNDALSTLQEGWQSLLKDLKIIAVHRAEEYQGYFGANAAVLLRRLAHRLAVLGAGPRYLVLARGCANGMELGRNLTGQYFQAVSDLEAPVGRRHYFAVCPQDQDGPGLVDLPGRIARAALACVGTGRSVMVYCSGEGQARTAFDLARAMGEASELDEDALSLVMGEPSLPPDAAGAEAGESLRPRAVFAIIGQDKVTGPGDFDGVIVAGSISNSLAALTQLERAGGAGKDQSFALFYTANDVDGRFAVRNFETLLGKEPAQVAVDPDLPEVINAHLPTLLHEMEGRIYSFSRETLGNAVFQALRREAATLWRDEPDSHTVSLRPSGQEQWGLWFEGQELSSLSPYGKFREIYPGSVVARGGRKYRVASIDPGDGADRPPSISLEGAEALANLRTAPSFSTSVGVLEESLCLSLAPGASLSLGRVSVEEVLENVSVIDESGSPEPDDAAREGQDSPELVTATFAPDEEIAWSMHSQAFWIDVSGLAERDASGTADSPVPGDAAITALAQMFRVGARFTFPVGKYDLAVYSQGSSVFIVEVSCEAHGIAKKVFDLWRDILSRGASIARNCRGVAGCAYCLLPVSPYDKPVDQAGGLALADRLLEITSGS